MPLCSGNGKGAAGLRQYRQDTYAARPAGIEGNSSQRQQAYCTAFRRRGDQHVRRRAEL